MRGIPLLLILQRRQIRIPRLLPLAHKHVQRPHPRLPIRLAKEHHRRPLGRHLPFHQLIHPRLLHAMQARHQPIIRPALQRLRNLQNNIRRRRKPNRLIRPSIRSRAQRILQPRNSTRKNKTNNPKISMRPRAPNSTRVKQRSRKRRVIIAAQHTSCIRAARRKCVFWNSTR